MKAVEFVKKYGLDKANQAVCRDIAPYAKAVCVYNGELAFSVSMGGPEWVLIKDLKQIVDAFELVESYGSIDDAKNYLDNLRLDSKTELEQALKLVEECNA